MIMWSPGALTQPALCYCSPKLPSTMMTTCSAIKSASWECVSSVWLMIPLCNRIFPLKCYGKCNRRLPKVSGFKILEGTRRESRPQIQWFLSLYHKISHFLPGYCCFAATLWCCFSNDYKNAEILEVVINFFARERTLALHISHCRTKNTLSVMVSSSCPTGSCTSERGKCSGAIFYWLVFLDTALYLSLVSRESYRLEMSNNIVNCDLLSRPSLSLSVSTGWIKRKWPSCSIFLKCIYRRLVRRKALY